MGKNTKNLRRQRISLRDADCMWCGRPFVPSESGGKLFVVHHVLLAGTPRRNQDLHLRGFHQDCHVAIHQLVPVATTLDGVRYMIRAGAKCRVMPATCAAQGS